MLLLICEPFKKTLSLETGYQSPKSEALLAWCNASLGLYLSNNDLSKVMKALLCTCQNQHILKGYQFGRNIHEKPNNGQSNSHFNKAFYRNVQSLRPFKYCLLLHYSMSLLSSEAYEPFRKALFRSYISCNFSRLKPDLSGDSFDENNPNNSDFDQLLECMLKILSKP